MNSSQQSLAHSPTFISFFAGVGGFDLGLERAGWECKGQVEWDKRATQVLRRHWPDTARWKDICDVDAKELPKADLFCGGFPCQDLSVAGKRRGFDGERSSLWHEFVRLVSVARPRWLLVENVPGLLSSRGGRDLGIILDTLEECGYGWCWRVLDSQFFGVPQRRRRFFLVGHLGGLPPPEILFEPEGVSWHPAKGRKARKGTAANVEGVVGGGCGKDRPLDIAGQTHAVAYRPETIEPWGRDTGTDQALTLRQGDYKGPQVVSYGIQTNTVNTSDSKSAGTRIQMGVDKSVPLSAHGGGGGAAKTGLYALQNTTIGRKDEAGPQGKGWNDTGKRYTMDTSGPSGVSDGMVVRRLTPLECIRLQGFPDTWLELECSYADAEEARSAEVVQRLWREACAEAGEGRRSGVALSLLTPEVLLAGLYGGWIPWTLAVKCITGAREIQGEDAWPEGFLCGLRSASEGPTPHRRESLEQLARELGGSLPPLPHLEAPTAALLRSGGLWEKASAEWPVRHARPEDEEAGPATPLADSQRYRQMGNAVTVNVIEWIGKRLIKHCP